MKKHLRKLNWDVILYLMYIAFVIMLVCFLAAGFSSCSNAKQVTRQADNIAALAAKMDKLKGDLKQQAIEEYVKANPQYCPEYNLDSLCGLFYENSGFSSDFAVKEKPAAPPDQPQPAGTTTTKAVPCKPQRILTPYLDSRLTNLQADTITALRKQLAQCQGNITGRQDAIKEVVKESKPGPWNFNRWAWLFFGLLILWILKIVITKRL